VCRVGNWQISFDGEEYAKYKYTKPTNNQKCGFIQQEMIYPPVNQHNYGKSHFFMGKSTVNGNFISFLYVYQRVSVGIGEEPRCFNVQTFPTAWRTGSQAGGPEFHTKILGKKYK